MGLDRQLVEDPNPKFNHLDTGLCKGARDIKRVLVELIRKEIAARGSKEGQADEKREIFTSMRAGSIHKSGTDDILCDTSERFKN